MRIGEPQHHRRLDRIAGKLGSGYCPQCSHCEPENTAELDAEFERLMAELEAQAEQRGYKLGLAGSST